MQPITVDDFFGKYGDHPDATSSRRRAAARWLDQVNVALLLAEKDGVRLRVNPVTRSYIAGSGNGGFRPLDCPIGAAKSGHKMLLVDGVLRVALDGYDPEQELSAWSRANEARLEAIGVLAMEDPRWTPTWCHWQNYAVPSGRFCYVPSSSPALVAELGVEVPDLGGTALA